MFIIGATTEHSVYAYSLKPFLIDEYYKIEDDFNGSPLAIVSSSYRYKCLSDAPSDIQSYLRSAVEGVEEMKDICVGALKIVEELVYPILPGALLSVPEFDEIKRVLVYGDTQKNMILGVIRGTERSFKDTPPPFNDLFMLLDGKNESYCPQVGIPFIMNQFKFREYPHIGVFGGSGSGKTYALRVLCEELLKFRVPGILLDPHYEMTFDIPNKSIDAKYRTNFSDAFTVVKVGEDVGIDFTELNAEEILTLLKFVATVSDTSFSVISAVHEQGDTFSVFMNKIDKLKEATEYFENPQRDRKVELEVNTLKIYERYKNHIPNASAMKALQWRLNQLKSVGIFTKGISLVEDAIMSRKMVVVRGRDLHVRMLSEYMIKKLYKKRRSYKDWEELNKDGKVSDINKPGKFPPFMIIADEAHNYAPNERGELSPLTSLLVHISQEARKYGVFLVLATQRPASLHMTLFAQLNTKFIFRTTTKADIDVIKMETNLSYSQSLRLPSLASGNAFASSPLLNETTSIKFRATKTVSPHSENPMDEITEFDDGELIRKVIKTFLPIDTAELPKIHGKINSMVGKRLSVKEIAEELERMHQVGIINKDSSIFSTKYYQ